MTGHVSRASSAASGESILPAVLQAALSLGSPSADVLCSQAISQRPGSASLEEALFLPRARDFSSVFFKVQLFLNHLLSASLPSAPPLRPKMERFLKRELWNFPFSTSPAVEQDSDLAQAF